jgi:uncharacterized protein (DUF305 family)
MPRRLLTVAFAATLLLGGCTLGSEDPAPAGQETDASASEPRFVQPGAPGEPSRELTAEEAAELELSIEHTEADVAFMQGMIPHHAQALRMTRLVPSRTGREDVPLFAERIDLSQLDEIDLMKRWLQERDEEVPSLLASHDHGGSDGELMPGMLTEEEFEELEAATGGTFDQLFLEAMIRHHVGALTMVDELYAAGGGEEPEIARFANHVAADQVIEIDRAQAMLADLSR